MTEEETESSAAEFAPRRSFFAAVALEEPLPIQNMFLCVSLRNEAET